MRDTNQQRVMEMMREHDLCAADKRDSYLETLFNLFVVLEAEGEDADTDATYDMQTVLLQTATQHPARNQRELLFKLALWRWDAPEMDQPLGAMSRYDAVAFSVFLDLVKLTGEDSVLKQVDRTGRPHRES